MSVYQLPQYGLLRLAALVDFARTCARSIRAALERVVQCRGCHEPLHVANAMPKTNRLSHEP